MTQSTTTQNTTTQNTTTQNTTTQNTTTQPRMTQSVPTRSASVVRQVVWWVRAVGSWLVLLAVLLIVALSVAVPALSGGTAYTVLSPSMRPTLPPGALVVTRPVQASDLAIGDVVTYQIRSGEPAVITHRVVALRLGADGRVLAQTKGDFNGAIDPELVAPEQLRGRLWYAVPVLGYVNAAAAGHGRVVVVAGVVVGLVGYAGWMFASSARDRRRLTATPQVDRAG